MATVASHTIEDQEQTLIDRKFGNTFEDLRFGFQLVARLKADKLKMSKFEQIFDDRVLPAARTWSES